MGFFILCVALLCVLLHLVMGIFCLPVCLSVASASVPSRRTHFIYLFFIRICVSPPPPNPCVSPALLDGKSWIILSRFAHDSRTPPPCPPSCPLCLLLTRFTFAYVSWWSNTKNIQHQKPLILLASGGGGLRPRVRAGAHLPQRGHQHQAQPGIHVGGGVPGAAPPELRSK